MSPFQAFTERFRNQRPQRAPPRKEPSFFVDKYPIPGPYKLRSLRTFALDQEIADYNHLATASLAKSRAQASQLKLLKERVRILEKESDWGRREYLRIVEIKGLYEEEKRYREALMKKNEEEQRDQEGRQQQRRERDKAGKGAQGRGNRR